MNARATRSVGTDEATASVFFRHYVPARPLSELVALFWYWRGHEVPTSTERILPTGTMELVLRLGTGRVSDAGISGPRSRAFFIERSVHDELLGIHFKPGGAFPFLGGPAGDLHDRDAGLADLWGERRAGALIGRLHDAAGVDAKFRVLERWLIRVANRPLERHPAVAFALTAFRRRPAMSSSAVADAVNLSQRRFIQVFRDRVGLTPKLYCRIRRFQHVLGSVAHAEEVDWLDVALSCGYHDQSHFIHDFREFTGVRPTEYLGLRIQGQRNHVRVPD